MPRVKISEYTAKSLLISNYQGLQLTETPSVSQISRHFPGNNLVVKVDQGIKKRGVQGLVALNLSPKEIPPLIKSWSKRGWSQFLVEPMIEHGQGGERYLALERVRDGWQVSYLSAGGIDVEQSWSNLETFIWNPKQDHLKLPVLHTYLSKLIPALEKNHLVFVEMNPVLVRQNKVIPLDLAVEQDSASPTALPMVQDRSVSPLEQKIASLDARTPASLKFRLLNPGGAIWMLLSGGGASLVLADEVADLGLGQELANYGEYSGAPSTEDVYLYTKYILEAMLSRPSTINHKPLTLIIAGGVANFTDVAKTFRGIIQALDEKKPELLKHKVKVYVRRGGPNEVKGLKLMSDFLSEAKLLGAVYGHQVPLTKIISDLKERLL